MPALHRRILPNCRPMADGGMRKCSAGACPPLGSGWGVAESTVPISCTKPQLRLFTPRCAGVRCNPPALVMPAPQSSFPRRACPVPRYGAGIQRGGGEARPPPVLVRKHVPDYDPGCALQSTSMPALHRRNVPNCRPMADGGMRKCSAGACPPLGSGWGVAESAVPIRCTKPQLPLFKPWYAGTSRHQRFVRK